MAASCDSRAEPGSAFVLVRRASFGIDELSGRWHGPARSLASARVRNLPRILPFGMGHGLLGNDAHAGLAFPRTREDKDRPFAREKHPGKQARPEDGERATGLLNWSGGGVDAVGGDFDFGDASEGEQELDEVRGRLFGGLFHDVGNGVGDRGLEHDAPGLEAGEVYAHELAGLECRTHRKIVPPQEAKCKLA